jgi:chemotaxis protein CheD
VRRDLPPPPGADLLPALRARAPREHEASFFFFDPAFDRAAVKVLPGEYFVHDQDIAITTTLGSCVAACLHDAAAGIGGMNHFMLPDGDASAGARYGTHAMELLINEMMRRGARRHQLAAKIFGGGQVMKSLAGTLIGEKNVAFVEQFLALEGIPLRGREVLDEHPRRVCLFPRSGLALCRRLPLAQAAQYVAQEVGYRAALRGPGAGAVELFR